MTETIRRSGRARLRARGASMLPALWPEDTVIVARRSFHEIAVGDVVMFARGDKLIGHRVIRMPADSGVLVTRGDRCLCEDRPVGGAEVLGVVTAIQRGAALLPVPACNSGWRRPLRWIFQRSAAATRFALEGVRLWRAVTRRGTICPA